MVASPNLSSSRATRVPGAVTDPIVGADLNALREENEALRAELSQIRQEIARDRNAVARAEEAIRLARESPEYQLIIQAFQNPDMLKNMADLIARTG